MDLEQAKELFKNLNKTFEENLELLSDLDAATGDGDHGISMLKGFKTMADTLDLVEYKSVSEIFMSCGRILMREIGGTCGPLFGSLFLSGAMAMKDELLNDTQKWTKMFDDATTKIMTLGKSKPGQKTMVDALVPTVESLKKSVEENEDEKTAIQNAYEAAKAGAEKTKDMLSLRGRSRYQGENSIGHQDAGATSISLIIKTIKETI